MPTHWEVVPNRSILEEIKERDRPGEPLLSVTIRQGVIRQQDLLEESSKKDSSKLDKTGYKVVRPGDIAYNKMRAWQGAVGVSDFQGIVSPAYVVERLRQGANPRYFHHLMRTPGFAKEAERWSYGITSDMWSLRPEHFKLIYSCVPPLSEQNAIVRFLDRADQRIRAYIRSKQRLIALLDEHKHVVVHQAVTGQIDVQTGDPYQSYKPSGTDWMESIPSHWTNARLKVVLSRPMQNGLFKKKDQFGLGVPLINVENIYEDGFVVDAASLERVQASQEEARRFETLNGDLLFVRSSLKLEGTGRSALVRDCSPDTVFECHLVQARPNRRRIDPRYLVLQMNSHAHRDYLVSRANAVTIATVSQGTISSCPVAIPPRSEQKRIIYWIDTQWDRICHAAEQADREIGLLREHRNRLFADVVTGNVDVRMLAADLPEIESFATEDNQGHSTTGEIRHP